MEYVMMLAVKKLVNMMLVIARKDVTTIYAHKYIHFGLFCQRMECIIINITMHANIGCQLLQHS